MPFDFEFEWRCLSRQQGARMEVRISHASLEPHVVQLLSTPRRQVAVDLGEHKSGQTQAEHDAKREEDGVARRVTAEFARGMICLCGLGEVDGLAVIDALTKPAEDPA
jgi:hypothetical protein